MKKALLTVLPIVLVLIGVGLLSFQWYGNHHHPDRLQSDYFDGEYGYHCDPAIMMRWTKYSYPLPWNGPDSPTGGTSEGYLPIDKTQAHKVCHITEAV